jgi:SAM-dependent methyltransferase
VVLDVAGWHQPATLDDHDALGRAIGPVLDIGCGPGRHVAALQARGCEALGIDISPAAVRAARRRGAPAIVASVWDRLPVSGYWQTALLLDGNVGIGGDPVALLGQAVRHLAGARRVIVELAVGCFAGPVTVQVTHRASTGPWFRWAVVTPSTIQTVAVTSGLIVDEQWTSATGRSFALLSPDPGVGQLEAMICASTETAPVVSDGEGLHSRGFRSPVRSGCVGSSVVTLDLPPRRGPEVEASCAMPEQPDCSGFDRGARSLPGVTTPGAALSRVGAVGG